MLLLFYHLEIHLYVNFRFRNNHFKFLKEIAHLTEPHTSENILKVLLDCEKELPSGVTTCGAITDNEPKMRKVRELYEQHHRVSGNFISCPGDPPHALQLVARDTLSLPAFQNVVSTSFHCYKCI